ncbi:MAG: hypothetical protein WA004_03865 [Saprospiraceae bacterium]
MNPHNAVPPHLGGFPSGRMSSREWAQAIISNPDPVLRNLQITQSYHQFTVDFAELVDPHNVCWCAYATWASKQAGAFIRLEQVPEPFLEHLGMDRDGKPAPRPWYWFLIPKRLLHSARIMAFGRMTLRGISASVAMGNRIVYTKLAPIFAGFLDLIRENPRPGQQQIQAFLDEVAIDPTTHKEIVIAFRYYFQVLSEPDPKVRAELIYAANLLIGLHEQTRLQEAIEGALGAPLKLPLLGRLEKRWQRIATQMLIKLSTPTGTLALGEDVPPLSDTSPFPDCLCELTVPEVREIALQFDYTPDTLRGSAARNWSDLADRLNYVCDLFRSRQQDPYLFTPPFREEQVGAFCRGTVPEGPL